MENTESRLYFASDYMEGAHPAIMKKLMETNLEKTVGYGQDPYTEDAKEKIRKACNAYTYAPAGKISIFDYSQIIFATMLGFVLFGEIPDKYSFTGYVLIILASLGTFLYNMRVAKAGK